MPGSTTNGSVGASSSVLDVILHDPASASRSMEQLQAEVEAFAGKEAHYSARIEEIDAEIIKVQEEIRELKKLKNSKTGKGAITASLVMTKGMENQLRLKEGLLARLRLQDDHLSDACLQLHGQIDRARFEQVERNKGFDRLVRELNDIKAELVVALDHSNAVLAERQAVNDKLAAVLAEDAENKAGYQRKLKEINKQIDAVAAATVASAKSKQGGGGGEEEEGDGPGSGDLTEEQEAEARASIVRLDDSIKQQEVIIADLHKQTSQLQEIFKHMIAQAGLSTLDQLVERFSAQEAFKYEIYGYVQHTQAESKQYEEMLRDIRVAQSAYLTELAHAAQARADALAGMRQEVTAAVAQVDNYKKHKRVVHEVVGEVLAQLVALYAAVGGTDSARLALLAVENPANAAAAAGPGSPGGSNSSAGASQQGGRGVMLGRDDVISVLGDLEQLSSDMAINFASLLRSTAGKAFLVDALHSAQADLQMEAEKLRLSEAAAAEEARLDPSELSQGPGGGDGEGKEEGDGSRSSRSAAGGAPAIQVPAFTPAGIRRRASLNRHLADFHSLQRRVRELSDDAVADMLLRLHRLPAVPAKAVAPHVVQELTVSPAALHSISVAAAGGGNVLAALSPATAGGGKSALTTKGGSSATTAASVTRNSQPIVPPLATSGEDSPFAASKLLQQSVAPSSSSAPSASPATTSAMSPAGFGPSGAAASLLFQPPARGGLTTTMGGLPGQAGSSKGGGGGGAPALLVLEAGSPTASGMRSPGSTGVSKIKVHNMVASGSNMQRL